MSDIVDRVRKIVVEHLEVKEEEVVPEATFSENLGADSLDLAELVMALEEEFDVQIADEDQEKIIAVKDAIEYIEKHL